MVVIFQAGLELRGGGRDRGFGHRTRENFEKLVTKQISKKLPI